MTCDICITFTEKYCELCITLINSQKCYTSNTLKFKECVVKFTTN